ncbi:MAG TPA: crossover junction endodeoxyribonuclease RuvC [Polyangiales bacterium]|nr:crossover junction endodeoxyribonuclease RuvC [Polyangiales bacterium]
MRVLGIDPGSRRTGWGVVQLEGTRLRHIGAGTIMLSDKTPLPNRLRVIHEELAGIIALHRPDTMAVEEIFFAKYANAALKLGHARGVALLVAAQSEIGVHEYPPAIVKRTIVGRGAADKAQVGRLVMALLGLGTPPEEDAADALAVAITHIQAARSSVR